MSHEHIPVMLEEVVEALSPADQEVYVDGTFGRGGYSSAFLDAADCTVVAIDRDEDAAQRAATLKEKYAERLIFQRGTFGDVSALAKDAGHDMVDGFVLDIGVSSPQIDAAARGFSFMQDGPLDMRMDQAQELTAAMIVNQWDEEELADTFYHYGEERKSRRIARVIVEKRSQEPIETTKQLADIVLGAIGKKEKIHPATRVFQALRIAVNNELEELEKALDAATGLLKEGGRLVVVSFHSLEDRIVKRFIRQRSSSLDGAVSRHTPVVGDTKLPTFSLPCRRAIQPSPAEIDRNPRARSARMRVAVRTSAPI